MPVLSLFVAFRIQSRDFAPESRLHSKGLREGQDPTVATSKKLAISGEAGSVAFRTADQLASLATTRSLELLLHYFPFHFPFPRLSPIATPGKLFRR